MLICLVDGVVFGQSGQVTVDAFEISTVEARFGEILRVIDGGDDRVVGDRCHRAFAGQSTPCRGCPARTSELAAVGSAVRAVVDGTGAVRLERAMRVDERHVRVQLEPVAPAVLASLVQATLDSLAVRHRLSGRECEVLAGLARGTAVDELARRLRITPRTVKFHTANVLAKLQLDSRLGLIRLLLGSPAEHDVVVHPPARPAAAARTVRRRRAG